MQMTKHPTIHHEQEHVLQTYVRPNFVLERADGITLYDTDGKAYQDWVSGIAVNSLGYNDSGLNQVIHDQLATGLIHVSNLYHTQPHADLAKALCDSSFADKVYFCNSGAEANEAAIKFARKVAYQNNQHDKTNIVCFTGGFHGRTIGALALTPREKYQEPFKPLMPNVTVAEFNNIDSAKQAITSQTCAVIVEPIQGEGGIHPAHRDFLQALRQLCDEHNALLIFDEIQCGVGRTGTLWAYESTGVIPDIMTLAKPLAGGLPIGAVLVTEKVAQAMKPGDHGSTFAGGTVVTQAAKYVLETINQPEFLAQVQRVGDYLQDRLNEVNSPHIQEVRGQGLICAIELDIEASRLVQKGYEEGLLLVNAGLHVLRFVPPLIVTETDVDHLIDRLTHMLEGVDV